MDRFGLKTGLYASTMIVAVASASPVQAQNKAFNVPSQSAVTGIPELARQADVQILVSNDAVRGKRTKSVKGTMTVDAALRRLLDGTGIRVASNDGRTFTLASSGNSQAANAAANNSASTGGEGALSEEIVVTGTILTGVAPLSSPVDVYTRDAIEKSAVATTEDFFRKVPQNLAGVSSASSASGNSQNSAAVSNSGRGAAIDLRGLGSTLVLLNGRRVAPSGSDGSFFDISLIPVSALSSVQVLTDGASSIYGADAIGGVVNLVLRKDFDGSESGVRYGTSTEGGASEIVISQSLGKSWSTGRAMVAYDWRHQQPLRADQRDFIDYRPGSFLILPRQDRHSVFATASQTIFDMTELSVDGYYSTRKFLQNVDSAFILNEAGGRSKQFGISGGITSPLWNDWSGTITGSISRLNQDLSQTLFASFFPPSGFSFGQEVKTKLFEGSGKIDGTIAGRLRGAMGFSYRTEKYVADTTLGAQISGSRHIFSAFGELLFPMIVADDQVNGIDRLEISLSARYDRYSDFGSSTSPRIGLFYAPAKSIGFRGTYSRSFKPPLLARLNEADLQYQVYALPDQLASDGVTYTLVKGSSGNASLTAERSRSWTAGIDLTPAKIPGLAVSLTWYDIRFKDRIAPPPLLGTLANLFEQRSTLAPFITEAPSLSAVQEIFATSTVTNPFGYPSFGPGLIEAIYDGRIANIGLSKASGLDVRINYSFKSSAKSESSLYVNANYARRLTYRATPAVPEVNIINTTYNPMDWRIRGGANVNFESGLSLAFNANFQNGYRNVLSTAQANVSSWTTIDLQVSHRFGVHAPSILRDTTLALNIQNLFDTDPPILTDVGVGRSSFGFDNANATPLGRFIAVQITKKF